MINSLINPSDDRIRSILNSIDRIRRCMAALRSQVRTRPLSSERYITDPVLSERLQVSRRTLQDWRDKHLIAYIHVAGKVLYREKDVQSMLEKNSYNVKK